AHRVVRFLEAGAARRVAVGAGHVKADLLLHAVEVQVRGVGELGGERAPAGLGRVGGRSGAAGDAGRDRRVAHAAEPARAGEELVAVAAGAIARRVVGRARPRRPAG